MVTPKHNTRLFNNIDELWAYYEKCLFCLHKREITVHVDSTNHMVLYQKNRVEKTPNKLRLSYTLFRRSNKIYSLKTNNKTKFKFNLDNYCNKFTFSANNGNIAWNNENIWITSECMGCRKHLTNSSDLNFNFTDSTFETIYSESESFIINGRNRTFEIFCEYEHGRSIILDAYGREIAIVPIITWDFSDLDKVLHRLETILTFG